MVFFSLFRTFVAKSRYDMKIIRFLALSLIIHLSFSVASAQVKFQVEGIAPASMGKIYLFDMARGIAIDSMAPRDNQFRFSGTAQPDQFFRVGSKEVTFVLISDGIPVSINFSKGTLKGSPLNEKLHGYELRVNALEMAMQYAYMGQQTERLDSLREEWRTAMKTATVENQDNMIPALYMNELAYFTPYEEMKQLLAPDKPYYNHPLVQQARTMLSDYEIKLPGKPFVELELNDSFGRQHKLSEWCGKGKYVLLHFWYTGFLPCRRDLRRIVYCFEEFHPKGLDVVGISLDTDKQDFLRTINEFQMTWTQLTDLKGPDSPAAEAWGIHQIPANILIGPDGNIVAANLFNGNLEDKLEEIFGE